MIVTSDNYSNVKAVQVMPKCYLIIKTNSNAVITEEGYRFDYDNNFAHHGITIWKEEGFAPKMIGDIFKFRAFSDREERDLYLENIESKRIPF